MIEIPCSCNSLNRQGSMPQLVDEVGVLLIRPYTTWTLVKPHLNHMNLHYGAHFDREAQKHTGNANFTIQRRENAFWRGQRWEEGCRCRICRVLGSDKETWAGPWTRLEWIKSRANRKTGEYSVSRTRSMRFVG